jgi:predicted DNA-binding transcriptional regulator YafY
MPAKTSRQTISRQWALLKLLPSIGPGYTSKQLCDSLNDEYKVSKRQVERDLGELEATFPVECNRAGIPFGWRWVKGAQLNIPGISMPEALSLKLLESSITPLLPKAIMNTLKPRIKLADKFIYNQLSSNRYAKWIKKIRTVSPVLPLSPPEINENILHTIQQALLHEHQIMAEYQRDKSKKPKSYKFNPLALIQSGPSIYLIATVNDFTDRRLYALHRFTQAEETNKSVKTPPDYCLDKFIKEKKQEFGSGKLIKIKGNISKYLSKILQETPLSEDQSISIKNDRDLITATLRDTWQFKMWVLSQADGIEINEPKELRKCISKRLKSASDLYSEN